MISIFISRLALPSVEALPNTWTGAAYQIRQLGGNDHRSPGQARWYQTDLSAGSRRVLDRDRRRQVL